MEFLGKKTIVLFSSNKGEHSCPYCSTPKSITFIMRAKYHHLLSLPIFPYKKTGFSKCGNCKQILNGSEMPENLKTTYRELKKSARYPWYLYIGIILLIGFAIFAYKTNLFVLPD